MFRTAEFFPMSIFSIQYYFEKLVEQPSESLFVQHDECNPLPASQSVPCMLPLGTRDMQLKDLIPIFNIQFAIKKQQSLEACCLQ